MTSRKMNPVRVQLLGPVEIRADDRRQPVPGRPQRSLLALLALWPEQHLSVDQLIEWTWGDRLPANPRAALQTRASRLRSALGPHGTRVESGAEWYRLAVDGDAVDAIRFVEVVTRPPPIDTALVADVLLSWAGEPFADAERLAVFEREDQRLRHLRANGFVHLIDEYIRVDRIDEAVRVTEDGLRFFPFDDRLMRRLLRTGTDRTGVGDLRARFDRWCDNYLALFGEPPEDRTVDLAEAVLARANEPPVPTAVRRPAPGADNADRRLQLIANAALVGDDHRRIAATDGGALVVFGPAGAGKTMVGAHWLTQRNRAGAQTIAVRFDATSEPFAGLIDEVLPLSEHVDKAHNARLRANAIGRQVQHRAAHGPVAILLEDLHNATAADAMAVETIVLLTSGEVETMITSRPRLVNDAVSTMARRIQSLPTVATATLAGIDGEAALVLARHRLPGWDDRHRRALTGALLERTNGHPLTMDAAFRRAQQMDPHEAIERVRHGSGPELLDHLIAALEAAEAGVALLISLAGRPLHHDELVEVSGLGEGELDAALGQLTNLGIISGMSRGPWFIAHDLFRDALDGSVGTPEAVEALMGLARTQGTPSEVVRLMCYDPARDPGEVAVALNVELGDRMRHHDYSVAAKLGDFCHRRLFGRLTRVPDEAVTEAWIRTAIAYEYLGDRERADDYFESALDNAIALGAGELVVSAAIGSGVLGRSRIDDRSSIRLSRAVVYVEASGSEEQLARLLYEQASRRFSASRSVDRDDIDRLRRTAADGMSLPRAWAAMAELWQIYSLPLAKSGLEEKATEAADLAAKASDRDVQLLTEGMVLEAHLRAGKLGDARRSAERLFGLAHLELRPRSQWFVACARASLALLIGNVDQWRANLNAAESLSSDYELVDGATVSLVQRIAAAVHGLDPSAVGPGENAERQLSGIDFGDVDDDPAVGAVLAWLCADSDPDVARQVTNESVAAMVGRSDQPLTRAGMGLAGYVADRLGGIDTEPIIATLYPYRNEIITVGVANCTLGPVNAVLSRLVRRHGDQDEADALEAELRDWASRVGAIPWSA